MRRCVSLLLFALLTGCTTTRFETNNQMAGMAPMLSVERLLQAVNTNDLEAMSRVFGTADGPIGDTGSTFGCAFKRMGSWIGLSDRCLQRRDVELRLNAIALVLRHDDYEIRSDRNVPGREHPTTRVDVDVTRGERTFRDVGFTVVQSGNRWLVQEIELAKLTGN